jgi:hypothetical protein
MRNLALLLFFLLLNACDLHKWELDRDDFRTTEQLLNKSYNVTPQLDLKSDSLGNYLFALNSGSQTYKCELDTESFLITDTLLDRRQVVRAFREDKTQQILLYESDSLQLPVITRKAGKEESIIKYWEIVDYFNKTVGKAETIQLFDFAVAENGDIFACGFSRQTIGPRIPWAFLMKLNNSLQIEWVRPFLQNAKASHILIDPTDNNLILDGQSADGDFTFIAKMVPQKLGKLTLQKHNTLGGNRGHNVTQHEGDIYHIGMYKDPPFSPVIIHYNSNLIDLGFYVLGTENCYSPVLLVNRNNALVAAFSENERNIHITEMNAIVASNSKIWCNRFDGNEDYRLLDLVQTKDFGFLMFMQHKNTGQLKIIKTDEEGATRPHPYVQNNPDCF